MDEGRIAFSKRFLIADLSLTAKTTQTALQCSSDGMRNVYEGCNDATFVIRTSE